MSDYFWYGIGLVVSVHGLILMVFLRLSERINRLEKRMDKDFDWHDSWNKAMQHQIAKHFNILINNPENVKKED